MRVFAPGRVNLIGDHTDYMGGLVLPMAIDRGITIDGTRRGTDIRLTSDQQPKPVQFPVPVSHPETIQPTWGKYVAGVAAELRTQIGFDGAVTSDLPIAGLSSSAALQLAVSLALGFDGHPLELAQMCQRAEHRATGVPTGIMDQLCSATGVAGMALMIDCRSLEVTPVSLPAHAEFVIVHSGQHRELIDSPYAQRRSQCERAETIIGPLRDASLADVSAIQDPTLRERAHHVVTENQRVLDFAAALSVGNLPHAGHLMNESHRSLRNDFAVSTSALDQLVAMLNDSDGVYGARLTGAGFGGAVVALAKPGSLDQGFVARPSMGARILTP